MSKTTIKPSQVGKKDSQSFSADTPNTIPEVSHLVKARSIPIETIIAYRKQGLSHPAIGKILGITRETVGNRLRDADITGFQHYKSHKADAMEHLSRRILNSISDEEIKRMAPDRKVWAYAVLYDKIRLELGQSTANVTVHTTVEHYSAQLEELKAKIDSAAA